MRYSRGRRSSQRSQTSGSVPDSAELESPTPDEVRSDLGSDVGSDTEPPITAEPAFDRPVADQLYDGETVELLLKRGTQRAGRISVEKNGVDGATISLRCDPPLTLYTDDVQEAVVEALSLRVQEIIRIAGLH